MRQAGSPRKRAVESVTDHWSCFTPLGTCCPPWMNEIEQAVPDGSHLRPYLSTLETGHNKALYKFTFITFLHHADHRRNDYVIVFHLPSRPSRTGSDALLTWTMRLHGLLNAHSWVSNDKYLNTEFDFECIWSNMQSGRRQTSPDNGNPARSGSDIHPSVIKTGSVCYIMKDRNIQRSDEACSQLLFLYQQ